MKMLAPAVMTLTLATAAAQADTPPTLQPALAPLAGFLGSRHCSGSFLKSGKVISSTETFTAELTGHALMMRHTDEAPFTFDALEVWGYDAQKKLFVAHLFDSSGGAREFSSPGWDGDRWVWTNVDRSAPKWDRFVFERQPDSAYRFTYGVTADGKTWTEVDSLVCITPPAASGPA